MSIRIILATALLAISPAVAMAQCMGNIPRDDRQAMSCLPGTAWDAKTGLCVPVVSS